MKGRAWKDQRSDFRSRTRRRRAATILIILGASLGLLGARDSGIPESAGKYYEILRERPRAGTALDRFIEAWLESRRLALSAGICLVGMGAFAWSALLASQLYAARDI